MKADQACGPALHSEALWHLQILGHHECCWQLQLREYIVTAPFAANAAGIGEPPAELPYFGE